MRRVLIVEDHELVRRGLKQILALSFGEVSTTEAADAVGAEARAAEGPWDLILLDLNLPGVTGFELIERLRRLCPKAPILVLTGADEAAHALQSIRSGASGFLSKRDAAAELVIAARKVMDGETYLTPELQARLVTNLQGGAVQLPHERLSRREFDVFRRIALGQAVKEIAAELVVSEKTVSTYLERIREKTGLRSHVEIARYAMHNRLVE